MTRSSSAGGAGRWPAAWRPPSPRRIVQRLRLPEHRPHGVADGVVDLARLHPVSLSSDPEPRSASTLAAASSAEAMQAAMPTPSSAAPAHRNARHAQPASARSRATRSRCPTRYCGSAATPPADRAGDQLGPRPARQRSSPRPPCGPAARDRRAAADASSPRRPTLIRTSRDLGPQRVGDPVGHPIPLGRRVGHRLDRRQFAGRHQQPRTGRRPAPRTTRVTTAVEAYGIAAYSAASAPGRRAASRPRPAPGAANTTASRGDQLRRRHRSERQPEPPAARQPPHRDAGPERHAEPTRSSTRESTNADDAAVQPGEHRSTRPGARRRPACARANRPPRARANRSGATAAKESSRDRPAYTPPSNGSSSRSVTSAPNRSST